mmetsp:Transcript_44645/g.112511  ORF Transcript_44645/g.112511 Transcript_44645/m.112511 type:complete len:205 (+) Transcript_44645:143-757(+)
MRFYSITQNSCDSSALRPSSATMMHFLVCLLLPCLMPLQRRSRTTQRCPLPRRRRLPPFGHRPSPATPMRPCRSAACSTPRSSPNSRRRTRRIANAGSVSSTTRKQTNCGSVRSSPHSMPTRICPLLLRPRHSSPHLPLLRRRAHLQQLLLLLRRVPPLLVCFPRPRSSSRARSLFHVRAGPVHAPQERRWALVPAHSIAWRSV